MALPTPRAGTSSLQKHKTINLCCLSHPVCGTLSQWPQETNTDTKESIVDNVTLGSNAYLTIHVEVDRERGRDGLERKMEVRHPIRIASGAKMKVCVPKKLTDWFFLVSDKEHVMFENRL